MKQFFVELELRFPGPSIQLCNQVRSTKVVTHFTLKRQLLALLVSNCNCVGLNNLQCRHLIFVIEELSQGNCQLGLLVPQVSRNLNYIVRTRKIGKNIFEYRLNLESKLIPKLALKLYIELLSCYRHSLLIEKLSQNTLIQMEPQQNKMHRTQFQLTSSAPCTPCV